MITFVSMMILSIFQTVEFYVITAFIAAAVVGMAAMPARRGAARQILAGGSLLFDAAPSEPGIVFVVNDDGSVSIYRFGLDGVGDSGAYSLAATVIGFDVTIDERLTPGRDNTAAATAAVVVLNGLGAERYHFHFRSEATGRSAAFSLNLRPGNRIERRLT